jgi:CRISPR type III-B/RAMP module RAMP protein Cmr1
MQFNVRFITPLLIHGTDPRRVDQIGLTGKALRGCWRFWFRAIVGGMSPNISASEIYELESKVFGSADAQTGNKFRMLVEPIQIKPERSVNIQFSQRGVEFKGLREGCEFAITILPRSNLGKAEQDVLLASIWLWASLGAIGQRERRGFGSPVLSEGTEKPFRSLKLFVAQSFETVPALEQYLKKGLEETWGIFSKWLRMSPSSIATNPLPKHRDDYFTLGSLGQVAVSTLKWGDIEEVLNRVHGKTCPELGGGGTTRLASPVFLRLHKVGNAFCPVMTWSKPSSNDTNKAKLWLQTLGFRKYLSGTSPDKLG